LRLDEALDLQYRLLKLFDAMLFTAEFPEGVRAALRLRGFKTGDGRQPQSANQQLQLDRLSDQLQCLLASEGFANEPISGCSVAPPVDADAVARIVLGVVGELRKQGIVPAE